MTSPTSTTRQAGRALITGADLLGAHTARLLPDVGWEVTLLERAPSHGYLGRSSGRRSRAATFYSCAPAAAGGPGTAVIERLVCGSLRGGLTPVSEAAVAGEKMLYVADAARVLRAAATTPMEDSFATVLAGSGDLTDTDVLAASITAHLPTHR